jgi:hypothetical protein
MAQVPAVAVAAVIRLNLSVGVAAVAHQRPSLTAADEHRLRGAAPLDERQVAVDELVIVDRHGPIIEAGRDTSAVSFRQPGCQKDR